MSREIMSESREMGMWSHRGGHLYLQASETVMP
jgi:hypothetical protein